MHLKPTEKVSAKGEKTLKDAGCDGMKIKSIHKGNARKGDMTIELVKIEKKIYSASYFEIPAGFTKRRAQELVCLAC